MPKIKLVSASKVDIKPFILEKFNLNQDKSSKIEKVSKKELEDIANELGLAFSKEDLVFTKKILRAYLERR